MAGLYKLPRQNAHSVFPTVKLLPKHLEDKAPLNEDHMVVELFREEYPDCTVSEAPESFFVAMFM